MAALPGGVRLADPSSLASRMASIAGQHRRRSRTCATPCSTSIPRQRWRGARATVGERQSPGVQWRYTFWPKASSRSS